MSSANVDTDDLFHAAMEHWWRRDRQTAVRLFRRVLDLDPYHPDALNQLGIAAFEKGDLEEAERRFRAAIVGAARWIEADEGFIVWTFEGNRPYLRAHQNLALVCRRTGRWAEAARIHEQMLRWNPNDHQGVRYLLGEEYHRLGRLDRAITVHRRSGNHPGVLFSLGLALLEVGDTEEALVTLLRGMSRNRYIAPMLLGEPWDPLGASEGSPDAEPQLAEDYVAACADLWDRDPAHLRELGALWLHDHVRAWREDLDDLTISIDRQRDPTRRRKLVERRDRLLTDRRLRRLVAELGRPAHVRVSGALDVESVAAPATPIAWVTDLRLAAPAVERRSGYPERARKLARYHGRITEAVTAWGHDDAIETAIRCTQRVDGRACAGHVRAMKDGDAIAWACTRCRDGGRIASFAGTQWDLSGPTVGTWVAVRVPLEWYHELEAIAEHPEARRPIARAVYRPDGAELHGSPAEYEALAREADIEHANDIADYLRSSLGRDR